MKKLFNKYSSVFGLGILYTGVFLLVLGYLLGWTTHNWFTITCLLLVIVGVIAYIFMQKKQSRY